MKILFFDGVCNLCNGFVNFLVWADQKRALQVASLQGKHAEKLLGQEFRKLDSVVLYDEGEIYQRSDAVLQSFRLLGFPWNLLLLFFLVPRFIRDFIYDCIASGRYQMFGKRDTCRLPTPEEKKYFLD